MLATEDRHGTWTVFVARHSKKRGKYIMGQHSHKGTSLRFEKLEDSILRGIKSQYVFIPLEHIIQA